MIGISQIHTGTQQFYWVKIMERNTVAGVK